MTQRERGVETGDVRRGVLLSNQYVKSGERCFQDNQQSNIIVWL